MAMTGMAEWASYTQGQRIKILRGRDLTQDGLAEKAGLSIKTVQKAEQNGTVSLSTLLSLAAALDADGSGPLPRGRTPTAHGSPAPTAFCTPLSRAFRVAFRRASIVGMRQPQSVMFRALTVSCVRTAHAGMGLPPRLGPALVDVGLLRRAVAAVPEGRP